MGLTGKYDFPGIQKAGSTGLKVLLATSPYTAWILKGGFVTDFVLKMFTNWLANGGLVLLNIGANFIEGEIDQHELDAHMDAAFQAIQNAGGRDKLTPEQKKAIDDQVIAAARKFVVIAKPR